MKLTSDKIIEIFYLADDFSKNFYSFFDNKSIRNQIQHHSPRKRAIMSHGEIITNGFIPLWIFSQFQAFLSFYVQQSLTGYFPATVFYNRFVELMEQETLALTMLLHTCCFGEDTGIAFVASTPIRICNNKCIKCNKVFKGVAATGTSTMGWFHGLETSLNYQ